MNRAMMWVLWGLFVLLAVFCAFVLWVNGPDDQENTFCVVGLVVGGFQVFYVSFWLFMTKNDRRR